ncbi:hypothetical protein AAY473_026969 [Plecturocebus cupreus]
MATSFDLMRPEIYHKEIIRDEDKDLCAVCHRKIIYGSHPAGTLCSAVPTREAEAGESLEPTRWSLQLAEIMPLHSSLGDESKSLSK